MEQNKNRIAEITEKIDEQLKCRGHLEKVIKLYDEFPVDARAVREKVFMEEQGFSYDYDETDDVAMHFVMFENGLPVAACRVFEGGDRETYILGRLAVKKEYRGRGYGGLMLDAAKISVKEVGGNKLILHSQLRAKDFYVKNGFAEYGDVEYEEDCPHIWMKYDL